MVEVAAAAADHARRDVLYLQQPCERATVSRSVSCDSAGGSFENKTAAWYTDLKHSVTDLAAPVDDEPFTAAPTEYKLVFQFLTGYKH
ncbi:unnamed protein product [Sphagnum jensenii]|uniref:Uncharacterized protein n=1 Tax=Sphagnum jensenii TaxID=128206 RepID=A0ABP1A5T7_9BRYO